MSNFAEYIWNYFKEKIGNEYGVAGLMGNLQAESGLIPYRVQGDFTEGYTYSIDYTAQVDNGTISEYDFVNNGPNGKGYGLAQWTFYTRKQNMYNMWKSGGYSSIGCIELACDFLYHELSTNYIGVLNGLKSASTIKEASDLVLHEFEKPADQSESVENVRLNLATAHYNTFKGTGSGTGSGSGGSGGSSSSSSNRKLSKLLLFGAIINDK